MLFTLQRPKINIVYNCATFNIESTENQKDVLLSTKLGSLSILVLIKALCLNVSPSLKK